MNLAYILEGHPDGDIALISRGRSTTYGQLCQQVGAMRAGLAALGVERGTRVAIACPNGRAFVVSYLATLGLGAVAVPLNPGSPAPELQRELTAVDAKIAVLETAAQTTWRQIDQSALPALDHVVTVDGPGAIDGATSFTDLLTTEGDVPPVAEMEPEDLAVLVFTSGTAGAPRAAMLSHGNLMSNIDQSTSGVEGIQRGDVMYGVLPLFHIFGLNVALGRTLASGATILLVQRFDPDTMIDSIRERTVTIVPGAPPMWTAISMMEGISPDAFSTVRLALSGAARLPVETFRRMQERFGLTILEGYGLTEASPAVTSSAGIGARVGSVGCVLDGMDVRLVDPDGEDSLVGDPGEVWVKGPNVFGGYLDDPVATARVLSDGWLHTGDVAIADADGYLYLVDRIKDLVIVSGFNVYPAEVEDVLASHPQVAEVGVIGVPHPHTGEAIKAYVVPVAGHEPDEDTLIQYCLDNLARYKCPSKILFVDELPRNISGKLVRRALIDELSTS